MMRDSRKMKTRYKIFIIGIVIITSLMFLQAPSILGQPVCNDGDCDVWTNWDLIYYNIFEPEYIEKKFGYPPPCGGYCNQPFQEILDYCDAKEKALEDGIDLRIPGGDLTYSNNTHYIDSNICEWKTYDIVPIDLEILDAYETQRKAVFYIEPTREQYILSIVKDLRADVKSFGNSVDMQSYGVNIDYLNKGITVATSDPSYDSTIQQLIDKYPTDVKIKLVHGMAVDESCSSRTADCNPIVGGIQTESDGSPPCGVRCSDLQLQAVLDSCNDTSKEKNLIGFNYSNGTHYIDNNTCEWMISYTFSDKEKTPPDQYNGKLENEN